MARTPELGALALDLVERLARARGQHERGAALGEGVGSGAADAARRAGDDDDLVLHVRGHVQRCSQEMCLSRQERRTAGEVAAGAEVAPPPPIGTKG
jgi:hypothetical protein